VRFDETRFIELMFSRRCIIVVIIIINEFHRDTSLNKTSLKGGSNFNLFDLHTIR